MDDNLPIIIGIGDFKNAKKEQRTDGKDEPASLMEEAIKLAGKDAGIDISKIDSISCVRPWSWPYSDLPIELANRLKIKIENLNYKITSPQGGNQPAKLVDEACQRISKGQSKIALITGGESLDSLEEYIKCGKLPPPGWTNVNFDNFVTEGLKPPSDNETVEGIHGLGAPIQIYALYENALRAKRKESFKKNYQESCKMYENFSEISSKHPSSWNFGKKMSAREIGKVTKHNRMINTPYPMLMCAFNKVNIAGAVIVTSIGKAKELKIQKDKWIYIRSGAGISENEKFYLRENFYESLAINLSINAALKEANLEKDDVDLFDFYSCFPIVPKLACEFLKISTINSKKPISLLGGLTSFGGAGNNYSLHAINEMTKRLRIRKQKEKNGLILANGGILSYQHVLILSNEKGEKPYSKENLLPFHCGEFNQDKFKKIANSDSNKKDDAIIETYTVDFSRNNQPKRGHIICFFKNSKNRCLANNFDEKTLLRLADMTKDEIIGKEVLIFQSKDNERQNLFTFKEIEKL